MKRSWVIQKSPIHGKGVFANINLKKHQKIASGIEFIFGVFPYITDFGSMINHSWEPSAELVYSDGVYNVYTLKELPKGEEITIHYRNTPWYIHGPEEWYK